ncbi:MAG: DciA family protein [Actinomycetota bacterium]
MSQPEPLEDVLVRMLESLQMPSPSVIAALRMGWEEIAGEPWAAQSTPLYIRQHELVVEAKAHQLVAVLRYGVGELMRRLDAQIGAGVVESVRVVAPPRE